MNSPSLLKPTYQFKNREDLFFAGQMTGVEGYVESALSGLVAGINAARFVKGEELVTLPEETAIGRWLITLHQQIRKSFQPMNANFGLLKDLGVRIKTNKSDMQSTLSAQSKLFKLLFRNLCSKTL
ncbi:FAD-dependent oxidoreductase [Bacillus sp. SL00103]